jgi:hypothetical protein
MAGGVTDRTCDVFKIQNFVCPLVFRKVKTVKKSKKRVNEIFDRHHKREPLRLLHGNFRTSKSVAYVHHT